MTVSATLLGTMLHGVAASRPAASAVAGGSIYSATDTGAITQSDGSSWATFATIAAGIADQGAFTFLDGTVATAPGTPAAGKLRLYAKTGKVLAVKDDAGVETVFGAAGATGVLARPRRFASIAGSGTTSVATFASAPAQTSMLFACIVTVVATAQTVSSITQTNVTWTLLHAKANGTSVDCEVWKGVPTGTPGTTVTINYSGSSNANAVSVIEWAATTLAGTLDQSADNSGTGTTQFSGIITPSANSISFLLGGVANGATRMQFFGPSAFQDIGPHDNNAAGYAWIGFLAGSGGEEWSDVPIQVSAAWANTIISVI